METSWGGVLLDGLKKLYITKIKGFDPLKLCVVTLLMEGELEQVAERESRLNRIAAQFGGIPGGAKNGEIGYTLTFVIAYIRVSCWMYNLTLGLPTYILGRRLPSIWWVSGLIFIS